MPVRRYLFVGLTAFSLAGFAAGGQGIANWAAPATWSPPRPREVTTLFGRVRPIPEIAASNPNIRGNAERMALNAPFQGSAADIIKIAMVRLDKELSRLGSGARLLLQVHDELVLEAPDEEVPAVKRLVADVMEGAAQLKVRLAVHVGSAGDWLSAK